MSCNCIDEMNAKLAEHNTEVGVTFGFSRNGGPSYLLPHINTSKIDKKKRVGPVLAIPTFCPFCGKPYGDQEYDITTGAML